MNLKAINQNMWDETARVERVILLATSICGVEAYSDDLEAFLEEASILRRCAGWVLEDTLW